MAQSPRTAEGVYDAGFIATRLGRPRDAESRVGHPSQGLPRPSARRPRLASISRRAPSGGGTSRRRPTLARGAVKSEDEAVRAQAQLLDRGERAEAEATRPGAPGLPGRGRGGRQPRIPPCASGRWPAAGSRSRSRASSPTPSGTTIRWPPTAPTRSCAPGPEGAADGGGGPAQARAPSPRRSRPSPRARSQRQAVSLRRAGSGARRRACASRGPRVGPGADARPRPGAPGRAARRQADAAGESRPAAPRCRRPTSSPRCGWWLAAARQAGGRPAPLELPAAPRPSRRWRRPRW